MGNNPRVRRAAPREGGGTTRAGNRSGEVTRSAGKTIARIALKLDGTDCGEQYLAAIKDTPFDWARGDEVPEHLQPAPGEGPIAVIDAGPKPWAGWTPAIATINEAVDANFSDVPEDQRPYYGPHPAPIEQQTGDGAQSGDPGPELRPWPAPGQPARDPMQTAPVWGTARREDGGQQYRAESGEEAGGRVVGMTAGWACRLCHREATRFAVEPGDTRSRDACCDECLQGIDNILNKMGGEAMEQENLTQMERAAIKEARQALFSSLQAQGLADRFNDATAAQMDAVILGVWEGVRASMQRQSNTGEIPF